MIRRYRSRRLMLTSVNIVHCTNEENMSLSSHEVHIMLQGNMPFWRGRKAITSKVSSKVHVPFRTCQTQLLNIYGAFHIIYCTEHVKQFVRISS